MMQYLPRAFPVGRWTVKIAVRMTASHLKQSPNIASQCIKNLDIREVFVFCCISRYQNNEASDIMDLRPGLQVKLRYSPNGKKK